MRYLRNWLKNNNYFTETHKGAGFFGYYMSLLSTPRRKVLRKMPVMYASYSYNNHWFRDPDSVNLFSTLTDDAILKLRNKECIFVLDGSHEGWAPEDQAVAISLYNSAIKSNIDPGMITFISGNLREKANFRLFYNSLNNPAHKPINVVEIMHWDSGQRNSMDHVSYEVDRLKNLNENYKNKYFLNLNRRNRFWRSYCVYNLHKAGIAKHGLISHKVVDSTEYPGNILYSPKMKTWLRKNTPIIADTKDFKTNWANDLGIGLHNKVLFNLTSETLQSDWSETSLFYSEKTFKPIVQKTPVIIWGQTGQNYNLQRLGYKLYTDWFDYEFDFEPDIVKRWKKLEKELVRVCTELSKMTRTQQIEWSMKNNEVLEYNYQRCVYNEYTLSEFERFIDTIESVYNHREIKDNMYFSKNVC